VSRWLDGDRIIDGINANKLDGQVSYLGQSGQDFLSAQMPQVQVNPLTIRANPPTFVNLSLL
jgi:hypothetical protein